MSRITLRTPNDLPEDQRALANHLDSAGGFINVYRAIAHSPVALQRLYELAATLWTSGFDPRFIEIIILSTVSEPRAPYPLAWHIADARAAGLTDNEIRAVIIGNTATLSPLESIAANYARELSTTARASDETFAALAERFDDRQLVELTMLVAFYTLIARLANALAVPPDAAITSTLQGLGL